MRQVFVHNNIPHEKREQWPTFLCSHPEGSYICHSILSGECVLSAQNCGLCERNHCETTCSLMHQFGICDHQDATGGPKS
jgi:hypothetical protein